jgi:hypothetical protein
LTFLSFPRSSLSPPTPSSPCTAPVVRRFLNQTFNLLNS